MSTFHHTREIPATVEDVFDAIANPARLTRWWGPEGFDRIHAPTWEYSLGRSSNPSGQPVAGSVADALPC